MMTSIPTPFIGTLAVTLVIQLACWGQLAAAADAADEPGNAAKPVCQLAHREIRESSGLALSHRHPGLFWTHNDSGDAPQLYAFDEQGRHHGTLRVRGARAVDWEDMGSFRWNDQSLLFVADVGDNDHQRDQCQIYIIAEPAAPEGETGVLQTVSFRYAEGHPDCEAVALDCVRREFLLIGKRWGLTSAVYRLPWNPGTAESAAVAEPVASIPVPVATGLDISPDGRRAIVATYLTAYEFQRSDDESWQTALGRPGRIVDVPRRQQGESVCYGRDGVTLYLTSEGRPCPLYRHAASSATHP